MKEMGRSVNYNELFNHEITPYPMALAQNGILNIPTNKSALGDIIKKNTSFVSVLPECAEKKHATFLMGWQLFTA